MKRSLLIAILFGCCTHVLADGGRLRFSRPAGPFLVTLFTAPDPLTAGPADFSVLVQDARSGALLPDAQVTLLLTAHETSTLPLHAAALHGLATNRLLQAANFDLPSAGAWDLTVTIEQAGRIASVTMPVAVQQGSRQARTAWLFALLPIVVIVLFILHQRQKARIARRDPPGKYA